MIKHLTLLIALLMTIGSQVSAANHVSSAPSRPINYLCNGETYIIISTDEGWASRSNPDVTVTTTYDGFWLVDRETGLERSLGKSTSGADVMYVYYADGTKRYDCVGSRG
jgi:hypothetical protein